MNHSVKHPFHKPRTSKHGKHYQVKRLGEELLHQGIVSKDQINIALKEQQKHTQPLGETLVSLGFINEAILRNTLSKLLDKQSIDLNLLVPDAQALSLIPKTLALHFNIIPVNFDSQNNSLSIAVSDIYQLSMLDHLQNVVGNTISLLPLLAGEKEITRAIDQFYGHELSVEGILHEIETGEINETDLDGQGSTYQQPLVRLVDAILADAVMLGASDIHFEPEAGYLRLRYRLDGVLQQIRSLHIDYWLAMSVRLKVISQMNIAETRTPQDGRINLCIRGHNINFRAASFPTTHGENFVLRVLDCTKGIIPLNRLGIDDNSLALLAQMMARPEGMILLTGPTGSGKTTTLYSMLSHIRSMDINIMTLEDPVEYPMELIRQTSINESIRLDFASGVRALLRQDPDVILIGEIRDADTGVMALRAAMTGHQVYSTLHTNSAIGAINRLQEIGIKAEMLSENIIGIVGQRLLRKLCEHCKVQVQASKINKKLLNVDPQKMLYLYQANGCSLCHQTGYKNRIAVLEIIKITTELSELIAERCSAVKLKQYLNRQHIPTLADNATRKVIDGITSLEEVTRVIDLTDRLP